jgi:hypothetical protein
VHWNVRRYPPSSDRNRGALFVRGKRRVARGQIRHGRHVDNPVYMPMVPPSSRVMTMVAVRGRVLGAPEIEASSLVIDGQLLW